MSQRFLSIIFLIVFFALLFLANQFLNAQTPIPDTAATEAAKAEFLAKICSGHGGVNCSIINKDASIVCNDGTIDQSLPAIYAVPQCHKTLEDMANQRSDFMTKSGCYPPSEMGCFEEKSYQNLYKIRSASGLVNSELSKNELAQCRQQIGEYQIQNADYKKCLEENNNPEFDLTNDKLALPMLKAVFCPIFYGPNSSYNYDANLCLCDTGYFMNGGKCVEATQICRSKYDSGVFAKNGNCYRASPAPTATPSRPPPAQTETTPNIRAQSPVPPPAAIIGKNKLETQPYQTPYPPNQTGIKESAPKISMNFVTIIFNSLLSSLKNILKLF